MAGVVLSSAWESLKLRLYRRVAVEGCCVEFMGCRNTYGYGQIQFLGKKIGAHRAAWMVHNGPIPKDLLVLHQCDNPPCINPSHLFLGTNTDNVNDMVSKGRQAVGDRCGVRLHPETRPRGEAHHHHLHPEMVRGESNGRALLTENDVRKIRLLAKSLKHRELAEMFGVAHVTIAKIVQRRLWSHVV